MNNRDDFLYIDEKDRFYHNIPHCKDCHTRLSPDDIEQYGYNCEPCYNEIKYLQS